MMNTATEHVRAVCRRVRAAVPAVATLDHAARCAVLQAMARALVASTEKILAAENVIHGPRNIEFSIRSYVDRNCRALVFKAFVGKISVNTNEHICSGI